MKRILLCFYGALMSSNIYAQRSLEIKSSPNFRELGGLQVGESSWIKDGLIFRSGSIPKFSEDEKSKFLASKINTIIDFRSDTERLSEQDDIPQDGSIKVIHSPIGSLTDKGMAKFMEVLMNPTIQASQIDSLMIQANKGFVSSARDFKPFFDEIKNPESVVLFHCTAGKDRTGLASSLFLHILGSSWETIIADFLRSNEAAPSATIAALEKYGIPEEKRKVLAGVKASYLESAWDEIRLKYSTVDLFLQQEYGIGDAEKQRIRAKYLK